MARSVCSASSRCSINHFEDAVDDSPWAIRSVQAPTMPCRRSSLSSVVTSRFMVELRCIGGYCCYRRLLWGLQRPTQAVVACSVGHGRLSELQSRLHRFWPRAGSEAGQHVENVLGTERTGLNNQIDRHQHLLQSSGWHRSEYLCHDLVTAVMAHQTELQFLQRLGHIGKGGAVSQGARFALHQIDVVLPVVNGVTPISRTLMAGHHCVPGHHADARGIETVSYTHLTLPTNR